MIDEWMKKWMKKHFLILYEWMKKMNEKTLFNIISQTFYWFN